MFVIKHKKIFYIISGLLIILPIIAMSVWGLKFGIDFTGGSLLEIKFNSVNDFISKEEISENIKSSGIELGDFSIRPVNDLGYIIRTKNITNDQKNQILYLISKDVKVEEVRFNDIGATLGQELRSKAVVALVIILVVIALYVAFVFREVSKPISSWKYGLVTIIASIHDVLVPLGLFSLLGRFYGVEVDTLFIIAILIVLGYSINDTIIVFDRIRENLKNTTEKNVSLNFEKIVGDSLKQTIGRSFNTSFTTLLTLTCLLVFGGSATVWFAVALVAGVASGTYSSIFFASPLLVYFYNYQNKKKEYKN